MTGWPNETDYNHYVQNAAARLVHPVLAGATFVAEEDGLPQQNGSGAFAVVFRMQDNAGGEFGLKCFLHHIEGRDDRYAVIQEAVALMTGTSHLIHFEYLTKAIKAQGGQIVPAVKMEWVQGIHLDSYVDGRLQDVRALVSLSKQLREVIVNLRRQNAAHGDLQHGNILVLRNGKIRLVDLDGMFVPQLEGERRLEAGHPNYCHPYTDGHKFDATIDDFPAWLIYFSLRAVAKDPTLWQMRAGTDQLLFSAEELAAPQESEIVLRLTKSSDRELRDIGLKLGALLEKPSSEVPPFFDESYSEPSVLKWKQQPAPAWTGEPTSDPFTPVSLPKVSPTDGSQGTRKSKSNKRAPWPRDQSRGKTAVHRSTTWPTPDWARLTSSDFVIHSVLPDIPPASRKKPETTTQSAANSASQAVASSSHAASWFIKIFQRDLPPVVLVATIGVVLIVVVLLLAIHVI
jgi:hypothetical protein